MKKVETKIQLKNSIAKDIINLMTGGINSKQILSSRSDFILGLLENETITNRIKCHSSEQMIKRI